MEAEMAKDVALSMQIVDPPTDKMEDGVVVVVESGGIECKREQDEDSAASLRTNIEQDGSVEQSEHVVDENSELIKVALAADHPEVSTEKDNGATNSEGLQHPETVLEAGVVQSGKTLDQVDSEADKNFPEKNSTIYDENSPSLKLAYGSKDAVYGSGTHRQKDAANDADADDESAVNDMDDMTDSEKFTEARSAEVESMADTTNKAGFDIVVLPAADDISREEFEDDVLPGDEDSKISSGRLADYACEECGKRFTHVSSKKRHMLKHKEGESPVVYQCLACSKTFQYNSSLKRHLRIHSEETTGKAYTCTECSKAFMYATSLKRHLKTHSGKEIYPCSHCQRCFEYVSSLKRHEKLHTVGKGFRCGVCSKSFGYLSSLTRHQRVHQKSLTCEKCNKDFRLYKSYVKHLEEHGHVLGEDELAAMQVEETVDEDGEHGEEEFQSDDEDDEKCKAERHDVENEMADGDVSASMVVDNIPPSSEGNQMNAIQGDIIDLQSAENHPFVKFVVSQNTVTLEHLQSLEAAHGAHSTEDTSNQDAVAYAVVHTADGSSVVSENCMAANSIQDLASNQVGGIVLVELDQNNKVTERHMEGLQASNLLQLLQAVEGFAVETNLQTEKQGEQLPDANADSEVAIETESATEADGSQ